MNTHTPRTPIKPIAPAGKHQNNRATLHDARDLMVSTDRNANDSSLPLWALGAKRIAQGLGGSGQSKEAHKRNEQEQIELARKVRQMKWGMTIVALAAALMFSLQAGAQESKSPAKTAASKTTKKAPAKAVSGPAAVMIAAAREGRYPAVIGAMVQRGQGVNMLDVFDGPSGLIGFVLSAGTGERRVYYVTPDGLTAIYGFAFDQKLTNLTSLHIAQYTNPLSNKVGVGTIAPLVPAAPAAPSAPTQPDAKAGAGNSAPTAAPAPPPSEDLWSLPAAVKQAPAAGSSALNPGAQAPRVDMTPSYKMATQAKGVHIEGKGMPVYIVFDPACPYCHKTWRETRSLLSQIQIHWIPVGALGPRSRLLAETFIRSTNRAQAMEASVNGSLKPAESVTPEVAAVLTQNSAILDVAGVANVPLSMYMDRGQVRFMVGAPNAAQLAELARAAAANPQR